MTEIWFYHLTSQPLERALPMLLERSLERGWNAVVQATSEERLGMLDVHLWNYSDASFLPHGTAKDGDAEVQPVYLTLGIENPNGAEIRFFVERAQIETALAAPGGESYARAVLLFDGNDDEELAAARGQWKELKQKGRELAYWQQSEGGRWERKS